MILVIDNYDSFTFNLVQYLWELGASVEVFRNDKIDIAGIRDRRPEALVLSPGPCTPSEAGVCVPAISELSGAIPILGVCLGHQAIGQAFGGRVVQAKRVMHGKTSPIQHDGGGIFSGVRAPLEGGRYHSLVVERDSLPPILRITASSQDDEEIMAIAHREHPTVGVQFHPESVLTPEGKKLLANFLEGRRC
ncbi:MAG TPA: aminodeoxychorismate/anthranilate synthase component II [Myxococcaceae bacterium]|nr:aminodeoxychorismate/anthranilate synthase component II [Myxococcaceae bacterium]